MIGLPAGMRIWIVAGVTDLRRGFVGLRGVVQTALEEDPCTRLKGNDRASPTPSLLLSPSGNLSFSRRAILSTRSRITNRSAAMIYSRRFAILAIRPMPISVSTIDDGSGSC